MKKSAIIIFSALLSFGIAAQGSEKFQVTDIEVTGLTRIPAETVFDYLPVGIGDEFNEALGQQLVKELFGTGFFQDIEIRRDEGKLVIAVIEHPTLSKIRVLGNRNLDDEVLDQMLSDEGLIEGRLFSEYSKNAVIEEIRKHYISEGRYRSQITSATTPLPMNRVGVDIEIDEGPVARVKNVRFVGNMTFDDKTLRDISLFDGNVLSNLLLGRNKFSEKKLEADLENIGNFYQDRGFFEFTVRSKMVVMSDDKKDVELTITVSEGNRYKFGSVAVDMVDVLPEIDIRQLVTVAKGNLFSRSEVIKSRVSIEEELANAGFAFAVVNPVPTVDRQSSTVSFAFVIDLGPKTYVRRINIGGNTTTQDIVIRRELRQMEGAAYSRKKISRSQERIQRLGLFDEVLVQVEPVSDSIDEVDLNFDVVERKTGNLTFGVGYSEDERAFIQAEISRKNLFGSGRQLEVSLDRSQVKQVYEVEYVNPYYTDNGISRGIFARQKILDASAGASAGYIANSTGLGLRYKIPTSEYNALAISGEYENIGLISVINTPSEYMSFIERNAQNQTILIKTSFSRDTRDTILFPEKGYIASVSSESSVPGSDLEYYKLSISSQIHRALSNNLVVGLNGAFGYGGGYGNTTSLPFYRNFFAGGASSVRGYRTRSLGPTTNSLTINDSLGGNRRLIGNINLYFPVPGLKNGDSTRLSLFMDAGQVFGHGDTLSFSDMRLSAGLAFNWFTAIGPLALSYGIPINAMTDDKTKRLQITFGTLFR